MTDRAAELEAAPRANAALRVRDRDDEIGNAAVVATTFQEGIGASGAQSRRRGYASVVACCETDCPGQPNARRLRRRRWRRSLLSIGWRSFFQFTLQGRCLLSAAAPRRTVACVH